MTPKNETDLRAEQETGNTTTLIADLDDLLPDIPEDTIVSRSVYQDDQLKAILFGFAPGQELSEHTAARPAILHFLKGEAELTLGKDSSTAQPGTWAHMPAHLPHSILARTEVIMLLLMLP
jgi:quercetin dioxygenase-like cupin family protein